MIDKDLLPLTDRNITKLSVEDRIEAVISDGMWYHFPKWKKRANVEEEELWEWINKALSSGRLIQATTGAKSYRISKDQVLEWYRKQGLDLNVQLFAKNFPPRIWDGKTETEGFIDCPLREIGVVSFNCASEVIPEVKKALKGIAKVKEFSPGAYKAYGLSSEYIKKIIEEVFKNNPTITEGRKIYSRYAKRREIVDFSNDFIEPLVSFYVKFAESLVSRSMETINIFLPDEADRSSQITMWVLTAIEKFDEKSAVPFSGYLNNVLGKWPYDLPTNILGRDLSKFQKAKRQAVKKICEDSGLDDYAPNTGEISKIMGLTTEEYLDLDEKYKAWQMSINPGELNWSDDGGEKMIERNLSGDLTPFSSGELTFEQARLMNSISSSIIKAGIHTGMTSEAFKVAQLVDKDNLNANSLQKIDEDYVKELRAILSEEISR